MNEPLRYGGETLYQSNFDKRTEAETVLQVVREHRGPVYLLSHLDPEERSYHNALLAKYGLATISIDAYGHGLDPTAFSPVAQALADHGLRSFANALLSGRTRDLDNDGFLDLYATAGFMSVTKEEPDG